MPKELMTKAPDIFTASYKVMIEGTFSGCVALSYNFEIDGKRICEECNEESITFVPVISSIQYVTDNLGEEVEIDSALWRALIRGAYIRFKGDARMIPFAVCACDELPLSRELEINPAG